jgi:hypothetical protein
MNIHEITKQIRAFADELDATKAPEQPTPFTLPPPPPGMQWHREDGWKEGDLPPGTRPHTLGEVVEGEGKRNHDGEWCRLAGLEAAQSTHTQLRTTRPLVFEHAGKSWTYHRPGDPMPCDGRRAVEVNLRDGVAASRGLAEYWHWNECGNESIIGWRYAEPLTREVELGPEDCPPGSVFRLMGGSLRWFTPLSALPEGVMFMGDVTKSAFTRSWQYLKGNHEINRPNHRDSPGNPTKWEPCHKTITIEQP